MPINLKISSQPIFLFAILFVFLTSADNAYAQGAEAQSYRSLSDQLRAMVGNFGQRSF